MKTEVPQMSLDEILDQIEHRSEGRHVDMALISSARTDVPALVKALRYLLDSSRGTTLLAGSVGCGDSSDTKLRAIEKVTRQYPEKVATILSHALSDPEQSKSADGSGLPEAESPAPSVERQPESEKEMGMRRIGGTPFNCDKCGRSTPQAGLCHKCRTYSVTEEWTYSRVWDYLYGNKEAGIGVLVDAINESIASHSGIKDALEPNTRGGQMALEEIRSALKRVRLEMKSIETPMDMPIAEQMRKLSLGMFTAIKSPLLHAERLLSEHAPESQNPSSV